MSELRFEWDERKASSNEQKHGVSFNEAETVFYDENARLLYDTEHSLEGDRYVLLGMSDSLRLLLVCHIYQKSEEVIRIISTRKATNGSNVIDQATFKSRNLLLRMLFCLSGMAIGVTNDPLSESVNNIRVFCHERRV